jgi:cytochrome P450
MIDTELAHKATEEDAILLKAVHPTGSKLLRYVGSKWRLKRIPVVGVILSDAALIREVFMDKENFTKIGKGASSALWTPVIGEYGLVNMDGEEHLMLKRSLASSFSNKVCNELVHRVFSTYHSELKERLLSGEPVDIVQEVAHFAYRTLWELIGLPQNRLSQENFDIAVTTLRSVTEGITVTKKNLSARQIEQAKARLLFVEELARETYQNDNDAVTIPGLMKQEGFSEEAAISVVKSLMITGTETIISALPRMTALFIKSDYISYLSEHPEHVKTGIDEALRVIVPTPVAARIATKDIVFHGAKIRKGERLILSTVEASRRYGDFNPFQELDKNIRGLWFGAGVHMCLGLPLAIAEAKELATLLAEVHKEKPLEVIEQTSNDKGHTGSFKKLIIQCRTS